MVPRICAVSEGVTEENVESLRKVVLGTVHDWSSVNSPVNVLPPKIIEDDVRALFWNPIPARVLLIRH